MFQRHFSRSHRNNYPQTPQSDQETIFCVDNKAIESYIKKMIESRIKGIDQFRDLQVMVVDVINMDFFGRCKKIIVSVFIDNSGVFLQEAKISEA